MTRDDLGFFSLIRVVDVVNSTRSLSAPHTAFSPIPMLVQSGLYLTVH